MADKISMVILKVDFECERCYKKIRKVLCKIQDKANIRTICFDEKNNAVTISGPFDAEKVCRKLCCKAGRVIKEMQIKGKEKDSKDKDGDKAKASKPAEKEAGNADKEDGGKPEKEAKADKATAKPDKEKAKDSKPEKKVRFELDDAPAADAKPGKAMQPGIEKIMVAKQGPEPPPMMVPAAAQGVAVPSIWPAPAGSVSCYGYNPACDQQSYYAGGGGGCRCGSCGKPAQAGGYYGVPVYDHHGWYYGNQHPYYQQQQPSYEDPNAGCSVM